MSALDALAGDLRILWRLVRGHPKGDDHAANLAGFYGDQADQYDAFRERLLPGRAELYADLPVGDGCRLVELGAGTGHNLAWLGPRVDWLARADLVDLCPPLLAKAEARWADHPQVHCHIADACTWRPEQPADIVVLAYSLTMIPDWEKAIANALAMLRPGGCLAVVDFTLRPEQSPLLRRFWQTWFGHDGVRPSLDHLPALTAPLERHVLQTGRARLPYLPGLRMPYFRLVGYTPS